MMLPTGVTSVCLSHVCKQPRVFLCLAVGSYPIALDDKNGLLENLVSWDNILLTVLILFLA